jgi:hypothetical protein
MQILASASLKYPASNETNDGYTYSNWAFEKTLSVLLAFIHSEPAVRWYSQSTARYTPTQRKFYLAAGNASYKKIRQLI